MSGLFVTHAMAGRRESVSGITWDYHAFHQQCTCCKVVGWPPIRSFRMNSLATTSVDGKSGSVPLSIKVSMDGAPYLSKYITFHGRHPAPVPTPILGTWHQALAHQRTSTSTPAPNIRHQRTSTSTSTSSSIPSHQRTSTSTNTNIPTLAPAHQCTNTSTHTNTSYSYY